MDQIFRRFLTSARADAEEINQKSGVARVALNPASPATFLCEFQAPYLRRLPGGTVGIHPGPVLAAILFPEDYLRSSDAHLYTRVAAVLSPHLVHPNVLGPVVCLGYRFRPGTRLGLIVHELYEIFTYSNYSLVESNSLNPEACRLLRAHAHLLEQLHSPPWLRRKRSFTVRVNGI